MAKVVITSSLAKEILKKFPENEALLIIDKLESLENNPQKGKLLSFVGDVAIKEIKHKSFRFYYITDGHILKFGTEDEFASLLIKFVKMSDKKNQQKIINQIKKVLQSFGFEGF